MWCQWDDQRHLHVLLYNEKKRLVMRGLAFSQKGYRDLYEIPLPSLASLLDDTLIYHDPSKTDHQPNNIVASPWITEFGRLIPLATTSFRALTTCLFTVVTTRQGGVCLCVQHPTLPSDPLATIRVTIFAFYKQVQLSLAISLTKLLPHELAHVRIFFENFADTLLIFVPGHYLQLLDLSHDHPPMLSMVFSGPEDCPTVPSQLANSYRNLVRLPSFRSSFRSLVPPPGGSPSSSTTPGGAANGSSPLRDSSPEVEFGAHAVLDPVTGRLYEYSVDRGCFLKCFERRPSQLQVQMLHFAIVHMQDSELADQIMVFLCRRFPHYITNQILQEFLLGIAFHHALHNLKIPLSLIESFPCSSLPSIEPSGTASQFSAFSISCKSLGSVKRTPESLSPSINPSLSPTLAGSDRTLSLSPSPLVSIPMPPTNSPNFIPGSSPTTSAPLSSSPGFNPLLKFDHHNPLAPTQTRPPAPVVRFQFSESPEGVVIRNAMEISEEIMSAPSAQVFTNPSVDRLQPALPSSPFSFSSASLRRFVSFFSPEKPTGAPIAPRTTPATTEEVDRYDLIEAVVQHWHSISPKENHGKLIELAKQYRIGQMNAVKRLFRHIRSAIENCMPIDFSTIREDLFQPPTQELFSYLHVFEGLYSVLEQLVLPFPHQFQQIRFYLGFRCLPLDVFIRYLECDILFPSTQDIKNLIVALAAPTTPYPFHIHGRLERNLLNRLSVKQQVSILSSLPPSPEIDRHLSGIFTFFCPLRPHFIDYEKTEESAFVPLSVWKEALKKMCPESVVSSHRNVTYYQFLTEDAEQLFSEIFPRSTQPSSLSEVASSSS
jgi:hypothetical protein